MPIQKVKWINNGILHKKNFDIYYCCDKKEHALRHGLHGRKKTDAANTGLKIDKPKNLCNIHYKGKF